MYTIRKKFKYFAHFFLAIAAFGCTAKKQPSKDLGTAGSVEKIILSGETREVAESKKIQRPFFWKVTRKDMDSKPVFLLGTIHGGIGVKDLPKKVIDSLKQSDIFVSEADLNEDSKMKLGAFYYQTDVDLKEYLKGDLFDRLVAVAKANGYQKVDNVPMLTPWLACTMIPYAFLDDQRMDSSLLEIAKTNGKKIEYLEELWRSLEAIKMVCNYEDLKIALTNINDLKSQFSALEEIYISGNGSVLWNQNVEVAKNGLSDPERSEEVFQKILFDRNDDWMPKIHDWIKKGGAFIAAGSLHFVGPKGIVQQLEADPQITVERIQ